MTTLNEAISNTNDDVHVWDNGNWYLDYLGYTYFGYYYSPHKITAGWRFQGISVPQGTTISSATFSIWPLSKELHPSDDFNFYIYGRNQDTAPAWASGSVQPDNTSIQTTAVTSDTTANMTMGQFNGYDVTAIVQEIINRTGWASGNAISFQVYSKTSYPIEMVKVVDYASTPSQAATLEIVYSPASTPVSSDGSLGVDRAGALAQNRSISSSHVASLTALLSAPSARRLKVNQDTANLIEFLTGARTDFKSQSSRSAKIFADTPAPISYMVPVAGNHGVLIDRTARRFADISIVASWGLSVHVDIDAYTEALAAAQTVYHISAEYAQNSATNFNIQSENLIPAQKDASLNAEYSNAVTISKDAYLAAEWKHKFSGDISFAAENLIPLTASQSVQIEAVSTLFGDVNSVSETLATLLASEELTADRLQQVGIPKSFNSENLRKLSKSNLFPSSILSQLFRDQPTDIEWSAAFEHDAKTIIEFLGKRLVDTAAKIEYLSGVAKDEALPTSWQGIILLQVNENLPAEWLARAQIDKPLAAEGLRTTFFTAQLSNEYLSNQIQNARAFGEWLQALRLDTGIFPTETLQTLSKGQSLPAAWLREVNASSNLAIENLQRLSRDSSIVAESLQGLLARKELPISTLGSIQYDQQIPAEWQLLTGIVADTFLAVDSLSTIQVGTPLVSSRQRSLIVDNKGVSEWFRSLSLDQKLVAEWAGLEFIEGNLRVFTMDSRGVMFSMPARGIVFRGIPRSLVFEGPARGIKFTTGPRQFTFE